MIKTSSALAGILAVLAACSTPDARRSGADGLREELAAMMEEDQRYRDFERIQAMPREEQQAFMRAGAEADRRHTERLKEIVETHGWPSRALVGEEGTLAAFLVVQHADHDPDFQARMLPLLEASAERGEVSRGHVAYLTDRVRVKQGRPQLYGTQYEGRSDTSVSPVAGEERRMIYLLPLVEDPDRLDERRRAVGLGLWIEYEREMAAMQGREPALRPRAAGE